VAYSAFFSRYTWIAQWESSSVVRSWSPILPQRAKFCRAQLQHCRFQQPLLRPWAGTRGVLNCDAQTLLWIWTRQRDRLHVVTCSSVNLLCCPPMPSVHGNFELADPVFGTHYDGKRSEAAYGRFRTQKGSCYLRVVTGTRAPSWLNGLSAAHSSRRFSKGYGVCKSSTIGICWTLSRST